MRALLIAAALCFSVPANAADITYKDGEIFISGELVANDGENFQKLVSATDRPTQELTVYLNSLGGHASTVISIGDYIHHTGMTTVVLPNALCVSTCALIWLGGKQRIASEHSKIGFNGIYNGYTSEVDQETAVAYAIVGAYLAHLGIGYDAIKWMMSSPSGAVNTLSFEQAKTFGITVVSWEQLIAFLEQQKKQPALPPPRPPTPAPRSPQNPYVVINELNLRSGPDKTTENVLSSYAPNDFIPQGSVFDIRDVSGCKIGRGNEIWCPVTLNRDGLKFNGWVSAHFLRSQRDGVLLACRFNTPDPDCVRNDYGR